MWVLFRAYYFCCVQTPLGLTEEEPGALLDLVLCQNLGIGSRQDGGVGNERCTEPHSRGSRLPSAETELNVNQGWAWARKVEAEASHSRGPSNLVAQWSSFSASHPGTSERPWAAIVRFSGPLVWKIGISTQGFFHSFPLLAILQVYTLFSSCPRTSP